MRVDFWLDPVCPWCWVTSRWITDVAPHRDLDIRWRPISLLMKNRLEPGSQWYEPAAVTHGLLRVMESVRAAEGDGPLGHLYTVFGEHIHHREDLDVPAAQMLVEAGLDPAHATAVEDPTWDPVIESAMAEGLALTGEDVGTPILAFTDDTGRRAGFFGPVISRRLPLDAALRLWDGLALVTPIEGFWELKRTRTEGPQTTPPA